MIRSKWPFYLLMAAPYLFVAASAAVYLAAGGLSGDGLAGVCLVVALLLAGVCVPATAHALRLSAGEGDGRELLCWTRRLKLEPDSLLSVFVPCGSAARHHHCGAGAGSGVAAAGICGDVPVLHVRPGGSASAAPPGTAGRRGIPQSCDPDVCFDGGCDRRRGSA